MSDSKVSTEEHDIPKYRKLAVIGTILLTGPIIGTIGTVIGIIAAFSKVAELEGNVDASVLAGDIGFAKLTTLYGAAFGVIGVVLVSLALFRRTNREKWFFKSVLVLSILWSILIFPVGLVLGLYLIISFCSRKGEFHLFQKIC